MKKKLSLVLATLMLLGLLAGCGGQPAASGQGYGGGVYRRYLQLHDALYDHGQL